MRPTVLILLVFSFSVFSVSADPMQEEGVQLITSYFGETVFHPGASVGIESFIINGENIDWYWRGVLSGYVHIRNSMALTGSLFSGLRFILPIGVFAEINIGLGGMLRLPAGVVYSDGGAELIEKTIISPAFIIPLSIGIGYEFKESNSCLSALFLSFGAFGEYPFNFYLLPHLTAEAGVRIRIREEAR